MRLRPFAALTVAVALAVPTAAGHAAVKVKVKPICLLVTDQTGDGQSRTVGVISSDSLDITSVDVATGPKEVKATLRLQRQSVDGDVFSSMAFGWYVNFAIMGQTYTFSRTKALGANTYTNGFRSVAGEGPTPTVVVDAKTITWTVPRTAVAGLKKSKQYLTQIGGATTVNGGSADNAQGTDKTRYLDLYPTCLNAK